MKGSQLKNIIIKQPYIFALFLLIFMIAINFSFQPNLFELRVLNSNLRVFFPLMLLAAGQTIVMIGGGIDISVGAIVSMVNAWLVTQMFPDSTPTQMAMVIMAGIGIGLLAGIFNGAVIAYLRLQPIVTTYATMFLFGGLALLILPQPGGSIPTALSRFYRSGTFLGIPVVIYLVALLLLSWFYLKNRRYSRFLFATGGNAEAAYATGVPVNRIRFFSYVVSGLMAALSGIALTFLTSSGDPRIGSDMTLDSITAVVVGGTPLTGGQGSIAGSVIGVAILVIIRNIISFAGVPSWWRMLVNAVIIVIALASPGLYSLARRKRRS